MFKKRKFIRKMTKFDRRTKKAPDMAEIRRGTPEIGKRPRKYLDLALKKLNISKDLDFQINNIFEHLRQKTVRLSGDGDPMPDLAGIIYFVCKWKGECIDRETIANVFGINKNMVSQGHKTIKNILISEKIFF